MRPFGRLSNVEIQQRRKEEIEKYKKLPLFPTKNDCSACGTNYHPHWPIKFKSSFTLFMDVQIYDGRPYIAVTCPRCGAARCERPLSSQKEGE